MEDFNIFKTSETFYFVAEIMFFTRKKHQGNFVHFGAKHMVPH